MTLGWFEIERDLNTSKIMNNCLDIEKPNFVADTGDNVQPYKFLYPPMNNKTKEEHIKWEKSIWDFGVEPMVKRNIPNALTLGNHDFDVFLIFIFF